MGYRERMRPDSRLTMNQTMLAIYEANPDAFGGNINLLKAGAALRIPSADEVFQISRGDAAPKWGSATALRNGAMEPDYTAPPTGTDSPQPARSFRPMRNAADLAYDDEFDAPSR